MQLTKRLIRFVSKWNDMARTKNYIEEEVIEKAMNLFWRNGYQTTSTRMLEKEMGINQFSIYSSFKNKEGVYIESIKCYKNKLKEITDKLKRSTNAVEGIKTFFYDFAHFSCQDGTPKGCLVINTFAELGKDADTDIIREAQLVVDGIHSLFKHNLALDKNKEEHILEEQANYLVVSLIGMGVASKVLGMEQLRDFIECTFVNV
ncbi:regulatory protein [Saccharicrinis fermentans DSM 9555 = JCM 21142]|uniref:Regulatory protein n=2 Tax=Saccharicrinis fermentans TaxID=982 RepID=W7Y6S4_9BACT|nr:regulatory protein [Saccharicrinis fermentans DSM 9555 = JCM 21142]